MRRVAIVHDWLVAYTGAERVLEQLLALYPQAALFAVCDFLSPDERHFLAEHRPCTTFIQRLPGARKHYRGYLPLMPLAIEQLDLSGYDLVISSSRAVAKGVITGPDQLHIGYVHSPIRYAWDLQHQYLAEAGLARGLKSWIARCILHRVRLWDVRTANGVDYFVANSRYIARRIRKTYRREAEVIYPPVNVDGFSVHAKKEPCYLVASRMVAYKRMDLVVEAFASMPERRLVVIGDGPECEKIKAMATANIDILGYQPADVLREYLEGAQAFVFAAEEDFGILPVEAQACGTPVIAYDRGGCRETVIDGVTGLFFTEQSVASIVEAVERFETLKHQFDAAVIRRHAEKFSTRRFREEFSTLVERVWAEFKAA
ncbi:MAG: glycosyltransferase family 4 protein [Gammaproteobacteria bacterium]|nr:glycosyltransferase family 4 protein [Gammaproteobacteria bacterium]